MKFFAEPQRLFELDFRHGSRRLFREMDDLSTLYLPSSSSADHGQVPLSAIVHIEQRPGPLLISHFGQLPATSISFNVAPGYSLGAAIASIDQAIADVGLPQSFVVALQGPPRLSQHRRRMNSS